MTAATLLRWRPRLGPLALVALAACGGGGDTAPVDAVEEDALAAPTATGSTRAIAGVAASPKTFAGTPAGWLPTGDPEAAVRGVFGPLTAWPLMPIHQVLLPDGRVLTYGSDVDGQQGGGLHYAVWDPSLGTGPDAFTVLPMVTGTNTFCAGQALLPDTGDVLVVGGTIVVDGLSGYGTDENNLFSTRTNTVTAQDRMAWRRWYPTVLTLASGDVLALGGRIDRDTTAPASAATYATTPEGWSAATGWHALPGATSDEAFGTASQAWYYPRGWVMPSGQVFLLTPAGTMFRMDPAGDGGLVKLAPTVAPSNARLQSVMFAPGRILSARMKQQTVVIDINGKQPVVTQTTNSSRYRQFGNATLLADGQVWFNGGSADGNVDTNDYLVSETWNPATGAWTDGATASAARLYHSSALLLPDGTVMTGGGGDPGPFRHLNGEIYYPPYLYLKDGSGQPAPRPLITAAPEVLGWAQTFQVTVSSATPVSRVTLVRTGTVTHDFNSNQRFQALGFTRKNGTVTLKTPASAGVAPPGYYLLFVFDANGVPSIARMLRLAA
jgi:hypothetical protein